MKQDIINSWYTKMLYGKPIINKFAVEKARELGLKLLPTSEPKEADRVLTHRIPPQVELNEDRHLFGLTTKVWFYPAVLEDHYNATGQLLYSKDLRMPTIATISTDKFAKSFEDWDKIADLLNQENPELNIVRRNILYLCIDENGRLQSFCEELPFFKDITRSHWVRPTPEFDRTPNTKERQKLLSRNPLKAYLDILVNENVHCDTLSLVKSKIQVDNDAINMI